MRHNARSRAIDTPEASERPPEQRISSRSPVPSFPPISRAILVASMTALLAVVAAMLAYPLFADSLFGRLSARGLGLALLLGSLVSLAMPAREPPLGLHFGRWPLFAVALLGGLAALLDRRLPLLLLPSLGYAVAASLFHRSLADEATLIERIVERIHPYKPDFVGAYCRKLTAAWGWFFAVHGATLGVLALAAPTAWWEAYTAFSVLPTMGIFVLVEYLIRKTTFRYYPYGGPIDRLFSAWFPAEETEMGRRSQAYIEARARELGRGGAGDG